ncbi:hypothetical protein ACJJTC_007507 [Scirpophaga incertulas]
MVDSKVAIVTGANKGLGLAIVKELCLKFDGFVYLTSRDEERGKMACEDLKSSGLKAEYHQLDVTDNKSIENFCNFIRHTHKEIDVLINNAGILFLKDAKEDKVYQAEQTILVNFLALVHFTERILPLLRNGGKIINISSSSGHLSRIPSEEMRKNISSAELTLNELKILMNSYVTSVRAGKNIEDGWGESPYVVSKVGVNAYTFMLHRRLVNRGIFVNCVHPGYVKSDMTRGAGSISPSQGCRHAVRLALAPDRSGCYIWHTGAQVPWDGPDPRGYIDGKL